MLSNLMLFWIFLNKTITSLDFLQDKMHFVHGDLKTTTFYLKIKNIQQLIEV